MGYFKNSLGFFREMRRDFFHTGAVLPSSRFLARAMTRPLREDRPPARILEVGAGTGAVTGAILNSLRLGDSFDTVEINPNFCQTLRHRMETEWAEQCENHSVRMLEGPVEKVVTQPGYDYVISCLPHNNFPNFSVRSLFHAYRRFLAKPGILTFFEYILIREVKIPFVSRAEKRRLAAIGRIVKHHASKSRISLNRVFFNVPPALVRHMRYE